MKKICLGLSFAVALSFLGGKLLYADDFLSKVDSMLKAGTISEDDARKMMRGHIEEELAKGPKIEDLKRQAEQLSTQAMTFRKKCDPKKDKGCSIM